MFSVFNKCYNTYTPTIVLGDLNIDLAIDSALPVFLSHQYSLKQLIMVPTTDYGSILDHIYTNLPADLIFQCGTLEAYFSDHKPVFITFNPCSAN